MPQAALGAQPEPSFAEEPPRNMKQTNFTIFIPMSLWSSLKTWTPSRPLYPRLSFSPIPPIITSQYCTYGEKKDICSSTRKLIFQKKISKLHVHDHLLLPVSSNTGKRFLWSLWTSLRHTWQNNEHTENKIIILLLLKNICLSIKFSLDGEKTKDVTIYLSLHTKVNEHLHLIKM